MNKTFDTLQQSYAQSRTTRADQQTPYPGAIRPQWQAAARAKGFRITARIRDRYHLALRCRTCGATHASRIYTLMSAQPQCPACQLARLEAEARAAGLTHLHRDPDERHYSTYRAACGHRLRRQHEIVRRVGAEATGLRCETCHAAREADEARARNWRLMGPDPEGDPSYRLYRHGCGQVQRVARANMQTGRFDCAGCGPGWAAAPSHLYAMGFTLENGRALVKLGYARDPESRLAHQLVIDRRMPAAILRTVPVASGHDAIRIEKGLHARLRRAHPEAVVDPACYAGKIRVGSEIYEASLTPVILALLEAVAAEAAAEGRAEDGRAAHAAGPADATAEDDGSHGPRVGARDRTD